MIKGATGSFSQHHSPVLHDQFAIQNGYNQPVAGKALRRPDNTALLRLIEPCDHGCQYLPIRYTERLIEANIEASVSSAGDSYDNALAEIMNGLYKRSRLFGI